MVAKTKTKYPIVHCKECGDDHEAKWLESLVKILVEKQLCFHCEFWMSKVDAKNSTKVIRVKIGDKVEHRVIGDEATRSSFRGYGGAKYTVKFFDGRVVETTNLWCQGDVPERFQSRLPVNAELFMDGVNVNQ